MLSMLQNVLANLISRPATRRHEVQPRQPFPDARGHIEFNPDNCAFCGACARRCPAAAIVVNRGDREITFEPFRCIICEACVEVCPRKSIIALCQYRSPAYRKSCEVYTSQPDANKPVAAKSSGQPAA